MSRLRKKAGPPPAIADKAEEGGIALWHIQGPPASEPGPVIRRRSPLSEIIIIEYDPKTGVTTRRTCPECLEFIRSDAKVHPNNGPFFELGVGDPLYFIGAGVAYRTVILPYYGDVAFERIETIRKFNERFSYRQKREWKKLTGIPFPYKYF